MTNKKPHNFLKIMGLGLALASIFACTVQSAAPTPLPPTETPTPLPPTPVPVAEPVSVQQPAPTPLPKPAVPAPPPPIENFNSVEIVRFVDADTVEVLVDGVPYQLPFAYLPPTPFPPRPAPNPYPEYWDDRLDDLAVRLVKAEAGAGDIVYRLKSARFLAEEESGGLHHIFVEVLDEKGRRIVGLPIIQAWDDGSVTFYTDNKPPPEFAANVPIYGALGISDYRVYVDSPHSDVVEGLGLPGSRLVSYQLTFQRTRN